MKLSTLESFHEKSPKVKQQRKQRTRNKNFYWAFAIHVLLYVASYNDIMKAIVFLRLAKLPCDLYLVVTFSFMEVVCGPDTLFRSRFLGTKKNGYDIIIITTCRGSIDTYDYGGVWRRVRIKWLSWVNIFLRVRRRKANKNILNKCSINNQVKALLNEVPL
jgi:hypothetical protein